MYRRDAVKVLPPTVCMKKQVDRCSHKVLNKVKHVKVKCRKEGIFGVILPGGMNCD